MRTMIFTPHPNLNKLDPDFKAKWITALMTSAQHRRSLCNKENTEHCCLAIAMMVEGADFDLIISEYRQNVQSNFMVEYPVDVAYCFMAEESIKAQKLSAAIDADGDIYSFSDLNDDYLTHPQIAELLKGNTVTIEVES